MSSTWSGSPEISASRRAKVDLPPPALPKTATLFIGSVRSCTRLYHATLAPNVHPDLFQIAMRWTHGSGVDRRLHDLVRVLHRLAALDLVDVLHALDHLAPDRVLLVEEAGVVEAEEELAVRAVRILRARHRGGAAHMRL